MLMHIVFNGFTVFGLICNMIGMLLIIKCIGLDQSIKQGKCDQEYFCNQVKLEKVRWGLKILFAGFIFQFMSTMGHSIYHVVN